ncbi:MAG: hypothetical protein H7145_10700 [Akkermansiaceae bacterium]|nr:hypothetical protein [Armatimonadota bacterium]
MRPLRLLPLSLFVLPALFVTIFAGGAAKPVPATVQARPAPVAKVYLFVSPDCPIANRYSTRFSDLARDYQNGGVPVTLVYSGGDAAFMNADFEKWAAEHGLRSVPRIRDTNAALAKRLHATTTPQAVVTDATGAVRYIGRIDDNVDKTLVTRSDVRLAIDAILAGKPIAKPRTQAFGCAIVLDSPAVERGVSAAQVTFARDVAPILNKNCVSCHRDGDAGPFPLDSYKSAKVWSSAIKSYTMSRKMPPFKADPHFGGPFADTRVLSDKEIRTLATWHDTGAASGDLKSAPAPPAPRKTEWELGTPDRVLQPTAPYRLDADGGDVYRDFTVSEPFAEDTYVKAMEFLPGNRPVVHHMIVFLDLTGATCAEKEGKSADGQPGWTVSGAGSGIKSWDWGAGWAPGMNASLLRDGMAVKVPKGARMVLQVHYHKSGKSETDLPRVALHLAKPEEKITEILRVAALGNPLLVLRPNVADNEVRATMILPYDATVHQILPHMHYLGKEMTVIAKPPSGERIPLIQIRDWEFNWQMTYRYINPIKLPKGTRLELRARYDNTADNPSQPSQPPKEVRFGEETTDEMCFAFIGLTRDTPQPVKTASAP